MDDLGVALRQLAGRVTAPGVGEPERLWQQGRARVRRRRVAAAVALAGIVVAGFAVTVRPEPRVVMPAGEVHAPAIPKNIYAPNRFLAGVSEEGPPGQLAVIAATPGNEEDWYGRWFGISATTGEYRTLDLPNRATDTGMVLSPDGRRIAYWVTGPTRKDRFPADGLNAGGAVPDHPATGVAVYDTATGRVTTHQAGLTDFGLDIEHTDSAAMLSWLGDGALVFDYSVRAGSNMSKPGQAYLWSPIGSEPVAVSAASYDHAGYGEVQPDGGWVRRAPGDDHSTFEFVDERAVPTGKRFQVSEFDNLQGTLVVSGGRIVIAGANLLDEPNDNPEESGSYSGAPRVVTAALPPAGETAKLRAIGALVNPTLLGWFSMNRMLVVGQPGEKRDLSDLDFDVPGPDVEALYPAETDEGFSEDDFGTYDLDIVSGKLRRLGDVDQDVQRVQVASDLASAPMVEGRHPPSLFDAFRSWVLVGGALLVVFVGWWLFRPSRRAWRAYLARERGDDA